MTEMLKKEFSRKSFVKGGGAMIVGFSMAGAAFGAKAANAADSPYASNGPFDQGTVDSWLVINTDNTVTLKSGKVELGALFRELARRELNEVHVEGGFRLNGSLLAEGLVDELVVYLAPSIIGDAAQGMFHVPELDDLEGRRRLAVRDLGMVGPDIRVVARFV